MKTIYLLMVLLICTQASAYNAGIKVDDTTIKGYSTDIELCIETLEKIPYKYRQGLRQISIWEKGGIRDFVRDGWVFGNYFIDHRIEIYTSCNDTDTLIHEIAHHYDFMDGSKIFADPHDQEWEAIYYEIYDHANGIKKQYNPHD